jgi:hypothetical protein
MLKKIKKLNQILFSLPNKLMQLERAMADQQVLAAKSLINHFDYSLDLPIAAYEFKVFSQWGDDGIIQYLIHRLEIQNKTFIEFGVEDYLEANTRFLLLHNNWDGLIMDGSKSNMNAVKKTELYWKFNLAVQDAFITCENINDLITHNGFAGEIGILSIDIDGNDYWVWNSISVVNPVIVIVEYNSIFGAGNPWSIPYQANFVRNDAHFSNLYYGSSLLSLCDLAEAKGYYFVGCNDAGNNSYFVRRDKIGPLTPLNPRDGYVRSKFRESRDQDGTQTFVSGDSRLELIKGMPIFNTRTGKLENI